MNDYAKMIECGVDPTPFLEDLLFRDKEKFIRHAKRFDVDLSGPNPYVSIKLMEETQHDSELMERIYSTFGVDQQYIEIFIAISVFRKN